MPESLQQKVDRMTAGMEVTVTFGGDRPCIVTGPTRGAYEPPHPDWKVLVVGMNTVRYSNGKADPWITAIDMPDPEPPFEMGARVTHRDDPSEVLTVTGFGWVGCRGRWEVEATSPTFPRMRSCPADELTLVPPVPAEPPLAKGDRVHLRGVPNAPGTVIDLTDVSVGVTTFVGGFSWWPRDAVVRLSATSEPAEPDCPAILVTYTDGSVEAKKRGEHGKNYGGVSLNWWLTSSGVATVQALRPAEYLRGGA